MQHALTWGRVYPIYKDQEVWHLEKNLLKAQSLFCSDKYNYIILSLQGQFLDVKSTCMPTLFKKEKRVVDLTENRGFIPPHQIILLFSFFFLLISLLSLIECTFFLIFVVVQDLPIYF